MEKDLQDCNLEEIDEGPLLSDILDGGLYGASSMTRLYASNMTLHAMMNQSKGHSSLTGALAHSVFRPLSYMQEGYPYLKKMPFLLPLAWSQRVISYLSETRKEDQDHDMVESIRLGNARIDLLKYYHIIES